MKIIISVENVKHILRLADEYQMKRIIQHCGKFLLTITKTKTNAMPIMLLAQGYGLTEVCDDCRIPLALLSVQELKGLKGFELMNGDNTRKLLLPHLDKAEQNVKKRVQDVRDSHRELTWAKERADTAERKIKDLESVIKKVYPQFKGMIECALYFAHVAKTPNSISKCPKHFTVPMKKELQIGYGRFYCRECNEMIHEISRIAYGTSPSMKSKEDLVELLEDMH